MNPPPHTATTRTTASRPLPDSDDKAEYRPDSRHRAAGNTRQAEYFRQLAAYFDQTALPSLEKRILKTAAERNDDSA